MNSNESEQERIEEEAATWAVRCAEGLSTQDHRQFRRWYEADPRHAAAYRMLEETCELLGDLPQVRSRLPARAPARRRAVSWSMTGWLVGGLAAAVALVLIFPWVIGSSGGQRHATAAGGFERIQLPDGSVMELNAKTEVSVDYRAEERRIELVEGEAHFTVAHDENRPFTVRASGIVVRAVGTAFNVRLEPESIEVLVTEGKVSLADNPARRIVESDPRTRTALPEPVLVGRNERVVVPSVDLGAAPPTQVVVVPVDADAVRAALSWQERRLVFSATPLRDALDQFNRRNRVQVRVEDPELGVRLIGGTFAADNVEGFVRLLEDDGLVEVKRVGEDLIQLEPKR